ncbi:hypothetical protein Q4603_21585 [Zobellia galactanivorans]|uniref:hypothetical protein n=1 Tax=Zobellia galactanivorans (strain DSM 12802 / CCUG 47099 / CIP 106680 / NCIMB 13871 / Dsij) TaxID=63186 RepID=UPI0026E18DF5|nr:hypothetical protein [Zobellia galactanivorans]MDO6811224.1 hypothetical protein [Zobellia galactanivorans]
MKESDVCTLPSTFHFSTSSVSIIPAFVVVEIKIVLLLLAPALIATPGLNSTLLSA